MQFSDMIPKQVSKILLIQHILCNVLYIEACSLIGTKLHCTIYTIQFYNIKGLLVYFTCMYSGVEAGIFCKGYWTGNRKLIVLFNRKPLQRLR